jgi:diguanylate cyclase (GGDEF)-like protein
MAPTIPGKKPETSESNPALEIESLKSQLAIAKQHRQELLHRLETLEALGKENEADFRWSLLALAQLLRTDGNPEFQSQMKLFKDRAKENAASSELKSMLEDLKDAAVKSGIRSADKMKSGSRTPSLFKWLRKTDEPEPALPTPSAADLELIRQTYDNLLDELRLNLDERILNELLTAKKQLRSAETVDDFVLIRKQMLELIKQYISRIGKEREEAAAFIREVGGRLIDLEGHMIHSLTFARDSQEVSATFTSSLDTQLTEFKHVIDTSNDLSELKSAVASRLISIKTALENKRRDDTQRLQQADEQMQQLQGEITGMKDEIQTAWQRAKALEQELLIDPLTGIYNRRAYDRRIEEELKRYQRYHRVFSLLVFDVDHFKRINDRYGHSVGDMCLKEIINRVNMVLRKSDFLSRYGGEEFVAIVPETNAEGAQGLAEKIRSTVEQTQFIHKSEAVKITISIGLTQIMPGDRVHDHIFSRADRAMYNAKQSGRNRVFAL